MSVFEMRGVFASGAQLAEKAQWVRLDEFPAHIRLQLDRGWSPVFTPDEARCLANQLRLLAARIDARNKENK